MRRHGHKAMADLDPAKFKNGIASPSGQRGCNVTNGLSGDIIQMPAGVILKQGEFELGQLPVRFRTKRWPQTWCLAPMEASHVPR
jgi:hypothetical protein